MSRSDGKVDSTASQSEFFDSRAHTWEENCYPPPVRERLAALIPEFGVRPGVLIPYLRRRIGPAGRIFAMDISFQMFRQARREITLPGDLALRADAHHIPFENGVFDRIICFAAFPHFHDSAAVLREIARVVKAGGAVSVAHLMSRQELATHHGGHPEVARDVLPDDARMTGFFTAAGLSVPEIVDIPGRYLARAGSLSVG